MPLCLTPRIESIAQRVTGRSDSMFAHDCQRARDSLDVTRLLLVGGAGSIGSATLLELLKLLAPRIVTVLDPNENNLVELVRSIRNGFPAFRGELNVQPLDYGSPLAAQFLATQPAHDTVLSFAALKHVRSERDAFSTLRMLEVNLLKADRFLATLRGQGHGSRGVFFVSTDKAANPVSLMGASKRVMELLLWAHAEGGEVFASCRGDALPVVTTARFANVAFSDGSLPWSFLQRLERRQPLAAPGDIKRYLVSPVEAGQLCLLAGCVTDHRNVVIPKLDPASDLVSFTNIAAATLRAFELEARWYEDEGQARAAVSDDLANGRYPVLITRSDTSGEKEIEEFVASDETASDHPRAHALQQINAPRFVDRDGLKRLLQIVHEAVGNPTEARGAFDKTLLIDAIAQLVPGFAHRETGKSLDAKV
jgi:FlaA1/EpsC-like NDP-sugar epimerase